MLGSAPQKRRKGKRKAGQRGPSRGQGYYPFLRWLGMEEQVSPLVWSQVAAKGMLSSSFAQATEHLREWGVQLSEKRVMRLTYSFGRIGIALTEQWISQLQQEQLPTGETFRGQRVGLGVDGGGTRLRFNKRGKRRASKRRGYYGDWREPKLFTLFAIDEQGKGLCSVELPIVNLRLKGNGKFWLPEHAEILLQGRCYWAARQWDYFCNQILTVKLDAKQPEIVEPDVSDLAAA